MLNEFTLKEAVQGFDRACDLAANNADNFNHNRGQVYASLADAHARIIAAFINTQTTVVRFPDE